MTDSAAQPTFAFVSAMSSEPAADRAAAELIRDTSSVLHAEGSDIAILFASMHYADALADAAARLREGLRPRAMIGCTCAGVIGGGREIEDGAGMALLCGSFGGAEVHLATLTPQELGAAALTEEPELTRTLLPDSAAGSLRALVLLADPFSAPMVKLLPALNMAFRGVPVVGGMASGARRAEQNRLIVDDEVVNRGAVALAIGGGVDVQTTVSQGCRPIGRPLVITRAKRHVVQELGGHNALQMVQEMAQGLPLRERELLTHGGVFIGRVIDEYKPRFGRGDFLIRNIVGVDPESGYVAIADPQVRVGQTVQFHVRDAEAAMEDFSMLLQAQRVHGPGAGALLFSCNGRGAQFFGRAGVDSEMVGMALDGAPVAGCFAAGEIGPVGGTSFLHGHTASLAVFRPLGV